jgi:hypothetical protein
MIIYRQHMNIPETAANAELLQFLTQPSITFAKEAYNELLQQI